jgi:hypothetical protein
VHTRFRREFSILSTEIHDRNGVTAAPAAAAPPPELTAKRQDHSLTGDVLEHGCAPPHGLENGVIVSGGAERAKEEQRPHGRNIAERNLA